MGDKRKPLKKKKDQSVVAKPESVVAKPAAVSPKKDAK